jgi:hypothetical protein
MLLQEDRDVEQSPVLHKKRIRVDVSRHLKEPKIDVLYLALNSCAANGHHYLLEGTNSGSAAVVLFKFLVLAARSSAFAA